MAETKRVIYYDQLSGNQPTNGDVIFVDNPTTGTHKMDLKSFVDAINNGFDSSIKSSGVSVSADNYSSIITNVNDQPVNSVYTYGAGLQSKVSNLPSNKAMTIINFAQKSTGGLGQVMLAVERNGSDDYLYFRTIGGSPAVWSSWVKMANNSDVEAVREALDNLDIETDKTLSIDGKPADAKATGDEINDLKADLSNTQILRTGNLVIDLTEGYSISSANGNSIPTTGWSVTDYIPLRPNISYVFNGIGPRSFAFYDINKQFIDLRQDTSVVTSGNLNNPFILPDGIFYGRFSSVKSDNSHASISAEELIFTPYTVDGRFADLSKKAFDGKMAQLAHILKSGKKEFLSPDMYMHGMLNSDGSYSEYLWTRNIVSVYKERYPFDVKFTPDSGYTVMYFIFNDDGTITTSGSTYTPNALTVPKYSKFKLLVRSPENATVEAIASHVTISYVDYVVPAYYFDNNYLPGKIDEIIDKSPIDGIQFAFITDVHVRNNAGFSPKIIKYIKHNTNSVPFVLFGGDVLVSTVDEVVDVLEDARVWQRWMEEMDKHHVYQVQGNHDYLGYHYVNGERIGFQESLGVCRQFVLGNLEDVNVVGVSGKLWYYIDIPTANTRIIFLNDYDTSRNDGVFYGYNGISVDQVRWVVENALNVDGIRVIFVSHQTYDAEMQGENQQVFVGMQSLFTALANHTAYSYGPIQKDFTNSTIEFVAHLCGHMHADASNVNGGVLTIQTTCDAYYGRNESVGTIAEQAFDIVTVDYTNSKLFTTRIGSGNDREFDI